MDTLTPKQEEIYNIIKDSILKKGYPPSVREIGELVGLKSTSSVHAQLNTLEKKGYIRKDPSKPRTIEITDDEFNLTRREVVNVPIVGTVAAGIPLLADENISDYFPIPTEFLPNTDIFMLKVKGESMINAGIYDGDQIIVAKQNTAKNGDIIECHKAFRPYDRKIKFIVATDTKGCPRLPYLEGFYSGLFAPIGYSDKMRSDKGLEYAISSSWLIKNWGAAFLGNCDIRHTYVNLQNRKEILNFTDKQLENFIKIKRKRLKFKWKK